MKPGEKKKRVTDKRLVKLIQKVHLYCLGKKLARCQDRLSLVLLYDYAISHKLEEEGWHHRIAGMVHDHEETQCPCYLMEYSSAL